MNLWSYNGGSSIVSGSVSASDISTLPESTCRTNVTCEAFEGGTGTLRVCEAEDKSDIGRKFWNGGDGRDDSVNEYGCSESVPCEVL